MPPESNERAKEFPTERFSKLVAEGSLYVPHSFINTDLTGIVLAIGRSGLRIDLYCPECNQPSTFVLPPVTVDLFEKLNDPHLMLAASPANAPRPVKSIQHLVELGRWLDFRCARQQAHKAIFIVKIELTNTAQVAKGSMEEVSFYSCTKIGQYPPHAELVRGRLKAISKVADKIDYEELRRAAGLISHDAAIGAFVYLRRVFERIVTKSWDQALRQGESLADPNSLRMDEKVKALRGHLPDIVVDNSKVYGILSLGLHELSEAQCADAYPVLEASVIAMLEEAKAYADKKMRDKELAAQIAQLANDLQK